MKKIIHLSFKEIKDIKKKILIHSCYNCIQELLLKQYALSAVKRVLID